MDYNEYVTGSGFSLSDLKANPSIGYFINLGKKAKSQFAEPDDFDRIVNLVSKNWFSPFDDQIFKTLNNKVFAAIGGYIFLKLLYDRLYTIQNFQKSSKGVGHLRRNIRKTILLLKRSGLWAFLPKNGIYNQAIPDKKKVVVPTNTLVQNLGLKRSTPDTGVTMKVQVTANKRPRIEVATNTQTTFSRVDTNKPVLNNTTTTLDYFGRPVWFKPNIQPLMSTTGRELQDLILINQSPVRQKMEKLKNDLMTAIVSAPGVTVSNIVAQNLVTDITKDIEPLLVALEKRLAEKDYIVQLTRKILRKTIANTITAMGAKIQQVAASYKPILQAVQGVIARFVMETIKVDIPIIKETPRKPPMDPGNSPAVSLDGSNPRRSDQNIVNRELQNPISLTPSNMDAENAIRQDDNTPITNSQATAAATTAATTTATNPNAPNIADDSIPEIPDESMVKQEEETPKVGKQMPTEEDINKYFKKSVKYPDQKYHSKMDIYTYTLTEEDDGLWLKITDQSGESVDFPISHLHQRISQ